MSLTPGDRVGPYEVIALLGVGGMGEVYRARDHRLRRDVALKVVSPRFALDPARQARFAREAQLLAALTHPNIATLYGLEETTGLQALVMEFVDGDTLAGRLAAHRDGIALPEAIAIARQVAAGLEAAHEDGIVHRDLKPANIALRRDGTVKLLDFGLAKALDATAASGNDPTVTADATTIGSVLGTPAYMSPEQARGQPLDKRTDIWSFGCVLYEMLTGHAAFAGQTTSDTIAAVLNAEPEWNRLPAAVPASIRTLLRRCLEKDPRQRLRDIGDARIELDTIATSRASSSGSDASADELIRVAPSNPWPRRLVLAGVVAALLVATFALATWFRPEPEVLQEPVHMTALLPPGVTVARGPGMLLSLAVSPNGRTLVIAANDAGGRRLYQRSVDRLDATPLEGTDGALGPFFSPDGAWIGFFADRRLKRVPASGGTPVDIAAAPGYPAGASWGIDDRIVFSSGHLSPLRVVDVGGGTPETLTTLTTGHGHRFPELLPDGRTLLFNEGSWIQALDLPSGRRTALVQSTIARYTASGHLIFGRGTTLLAAPFDVARFELTGPLVPVGEGVAVERTSGNVPHVAISRAGTLAYVPAPQEYALAIVQPDGTDRVLSVDPLIENPRFSPDGRRLVAASTRRGGERPELWLYELESDAPPARLTSDGGRAPVWTPDGASITYSHPVPSERSGIYTRLATGADAQQVLPLSNFHWLVGWTPEQRLAYGMMESPASDGITRSSILTIDGREPRYVVGPGDTWGGRLSPDGRWLAYYALDSGYFEIYTTPFPDAGPRTLIAEGTDPSWSPDGSEIYYRSGTRLMAARVQADTSVRVLSRRLAIEPFSPPLYDDYDIHPDGRTLALVRPMGDAPGREITVVLNWLSELRRLAR